MGRDVLVGPFPEHLCRPVSSNLFLLNLTKQILPLPPPALLLLLCFGGGGGGGWSVGGLLGLFVGRFLALCAWSACVPLLPLPGPFLFAVVVGPSPLPPFSSSFSALLSFSPLSASRLSLFSLPLFFSLGPPGPPLCFRRFFPLSHYSRG